MLDEQVKYPESIKSFWLICLNNPSHVVGDQNLSDEEECTNFKSNNDNFEKTKQIKINEFMLSKYEKKK